MFLRQSFVKKSGRTYLSIVHGFRDSLGNAKSKVVKSIGYLDDLQKEYDDPIAHFSALAKEMDKERLSSQFVTVTLDMEEIIDRSGSNRKNYGHIIFSKIYHNLNIDWFLKNARRHENFRFNTDAIMRLLVFSRLLFPCSKRASVLNKDLFFDAFNFSLDDVYDALTHFNNIAISLKKHLHQMVSEQYGRDTELVYYDVTNYYFEIDKQDDFRKNGPCKEHKKKPIVQMGLLLDKSSLPISYKLFPGNTHDSQTLMPMLTEIKKTFGIERLIVVADKALNSGDNIAYNTILGDGYIYSKSVLGANEEFKNWALDQTGYRQLSDRYKLKSKLVPDAVTRVTVDKKGKRKIKKEVRLAQQWIVFFSEKYAIRAKYKRDEAIAKATDMIKNPSKYHRAIDYGAAGYILNLKIDKETKEILNPDDKLILDEQKIRDEEKFDGYYAIVTSELDDSDEHIVEMYRGLWHIEESFKVTKSVFEARPIYLRTIEHINAHFLICFISLLIGRIVEMRLGGKYTIAQITETLRKVACSHLNQNVWLFDYANKLTDEMNTVFGTEIGRKAMTLQEIKKSLGQAKRS